MKALALNQLSDLNNKLFSKDKDIKQKANLALSYYNIGVQQEYLERVYII
jgi:hypothetical protein